MCANLAAIAAGQASLLAIPGRLQAGCTPGCNEALVSVVNFFTASEEKVVAEAESIEFYRGG
jgi:hypothetical protein